MNDTHSKLYELFMRFEWLHRRQMLQQMREFGVASNPHRGQGRVLALLKIKSDISQKELANLLDIRTQSLGELISKLEKNGLVTRKPSAEDKRIMLVSLTENGKYEADKLDQPEASADIFSCLTDEEQEQLQGMLEKLNEVLERQFDETDAKFGENSPFDWHRFEDHKAFGRDQTFSGRPNLEELILKRRK